MMCQHTLPAPWLDRRADTVVCTLKAEDVQRLASCRTQDSRTNAASYITHVSSCHTLQVLRTPRRQGPVTLQVLVQLCSLPHWCLDAGMAVHGGHMSVTACLGSNSARVYGLNASPAHRGSSLQVWLSTLLKS